MSFHTISNRIYVIIISSNLATNEHCGCYSSSNTQSKEFLKDQFIPVPLAHAFCMRWFDVLLYYLFPASATKPAPEEALDLLDLPKFQCLLTAADSRWSCTPCTGLWAQPTGQACASAVWRYWSPLLFQGTQLRKANQSLQFSTLITGHKGGIIFVEVQKKKQEKIKRQ
jgi:hypothetical protein